MDMSDKKKILVVDDEQKIRMMLRLVLENRGYEVEEAANGLVALNMISRVKPDLIIMDVMMPVMDGLTSCKKISERYDCPIIMLTAKGEDYDQVNGLESGADDYVIKPFTPMVLVARIEALFRRLNVSEERKLTLGRILIDLTGRVAKVDDNEIPLNKKEFDLLYYLGKNQKIALSRDQILESVWGYDYLGSDSTVDTHINRLRNKLAGASHYIKTNRGYGYTFEVTYEKE